jgi:PAS domain S-box-containing protein
MNPGHNDEFADAQLREDSRRNQAILDALPAQIAVVDQKGTLITVNKAWARFAATNGKPNPTHFDVGANFLDVVKSANSPYGEEKTSVYSGLRGVLDGAIPHFSLECHVHYQSEQQWFKLLASRITETSSEIVVSQMDITRQKQLEEQLRESDVENSKLAAIIEYADDAIISLTLQGIIIGWNQGAERLYGYAAEEMVGHSILILHPLEKHDEYKSLMHRAKTGERVIGFTTVRKRKDGVLIDVSLSVAGIEVQSGNVTGVSMISHDISKIKRLEEQFRQSQKMEALGTLAGGIAHDMNNLLTIGIGYSDMLIRRLSATDPMRELLAEIHTAGERGAALTRQLLAFSRKQVLEPKVVDLNDIVINTESMLRRLIGEDVVMKSDLGAALKSVRVDPGQIQQVLINLVVNARDAMPRGGRLEIKTANVTLDDSFCRANPDVKPGGYTMLTVTDSGTGMDEATKTHIFEPFFTTKELGMGTGLGMAVVHGIVTQSDGHIEIDSYIGRGTTIKVFLPQVNESISWKKPISKIRPLPTGNETLLLVEDDNAVRTIALHILRSCGYTLLEASNGFEAIKIVQKHVGPIDLVVSDVVMPHLSGRQLAERLEAIRPGLKILFVSGYTDDSVVRHGVIADDVAFLQKPFTPTMLAQKVREVLDDAKLHTPANLPPEPFDVVQEASEESFPASDSPAY